MSFRFLIGLSLLGLCLLSSGSNEIAWAHAYPASVVPAEGSSVSDPPREV